MMTAIGTHGFDATCPTITWRQKLQPLVIIIVVTTSNKCKFPSIPVAFIVLGICRMNLANNGGGRRRRNEEGRSTRILVVVVVAVVAITQYLSFGRIPVKCHLMTQPLLLVQSK